MQSSYNSTNTTINEIIQIPKNEFQNDILNINEIKDKLDYRRDAYGNLIKKNGKKHKVTFKDNIKNGELIETILIKKYKNKKMKKNNYNNKIIINKHYDVNFLKDYIVVNKVNCECSSCILY
jgi:hypothetical protein